MRSSIIGWYNLALAQLKMHKYSDSATSSSQGYHKNNCTYETQLKWQLFSQLEWTNRVKRAVLSCVFRAEVECGELWCLDSKAAEVENRCSGEDRKRPGCWWSSADTCTGKVLNQILTQCCSLTTETNTTVQKFGVGTILKEVSYAHHIYLIRIQ